jgi:hypothetical protein
VEARIFEFNVAVSFQHEGVSARIVYPYTSTMHVSARALPRQATRRRLDSTRFEPL